MDTSLFDQWITFHSTPNKYEVFISVARAFTIISALETLLLLYIYVGVQAEGCEQVCVCTHVWACKRTLKINSLGSQNLLDLFTFLRQIP